MLLAVELFRSPTTAVHVASRVDSPVHTLRRRTSARLDSAFVVNLFMPADDGQFHVVLYFGTGTPRPPGPPSPLPSLALYTALLTTYYPLRTTYY